MEPCGPRYDQKQFVSPDVLPWYTKARRGALPASFGEKTVGKVTLLEKRLPAPLGQFFGKMAL